MEEKAFLGVFGGSGVYDLDSLEEVRSLEMATPFGPPSDELLLGTLDGVRVAFLPRHGRGHRYLPSEVPYRANVWALRALGVHRILSISAVGSLAEDIAPGEFVLVDQFIDRTFKRETTFFGRGQVAHVPLADPVCPDMRRVLREQSEALDLVVHDGGTYLCIEGPQFSTRAESELYRSWGCRVIGMTNATEARLAREAGISFCTIAMVTDYDCWHPDHEHVTVEQIVATAHANARRVRELVRRSLRPLADLGPSPWRQVLHGAVMTPATLVPPETRTATEVLFREDD